MQADVNQHENIPLYDAFMGQFIQLLDQKEKAAI